MGHVAAGVLYLAAVALGVVQKQQRVAGGGGVDYDDLVACARHDVGKRAKRCDFLCAGRAKVLLHIAHVRLAHGSAGFLQHLVLVGGELRRLVYVRYGKARKVKLPLPIRKWKRHAAYGLLPDLFPFHLPGSPLFIFFYHPAKPFLQFRKRKFLPEPFDLFRLQIGIGHLDTDALQFMTQRIDVSIALRLRQMYRHRLCQEFQAAENALDLVNGHAVLFLDDTVCPALHGDGKLTAGISGSQKHFRLIGRPHLSLNLTVEPAAHLHGLLVGHGSSSVINIPGAKNKLHQIAHRDTNILFHEPAPFP